MQRQQVSFHFSEETIKEPIIYTFSQQFRVITNIMRADMTGDRGWVLLEIKGKREDIEQGLAWVTSMGVRVDPVTEPSEEV